LEPGPEPQYASAWSKDGGYILYVSPQLNNSADLWVKPLLGNRKAFPFLRTPYNEMHGQFLPDSTGPPKWIAYTSDESGTNQIYVRPFQDGPASGSKFQVTTAGGNQPRWRGDGKELYYVSSDRKIMAVAVTNTGGAFEFGTPVELFEARLQTFSFVRFSYDVSHDGKTFLLVTETETPNTNRINVVVNWAAGLGK
jgi:hypothetical protein